MKGKFNLAMKDAIIAQLEALQKGLKDQQAKFDQVQAQVNTKKQVYDDQARAAYEIYNRISTHSSLRYPGTIASFLIPS